MLLKYTKAPPGEGASHFQCILGLHILKSDKKNTELESLAVLLLQKRPMQTDGWPESSDWKDLALASEQDVESAKRVILTWTKDLRAQPEVHKH